ncbi:unnamed protein product [Absidia cylindrospora]
MATVFGVSNFAVTTAASASSNEARTRTISLYRKFQNPQDSGQFEQHRYVEDLQVRDVLLAKGQMEYQETMNVWKQNNHIMNYFANDEAEPKPATFLEKFYEGRS